MLKNLKKKSTTKYNAKRKNKAKVKRVPLMIPVIALFEAVILIAVSTYAWYYFNASKQLSTGVITVAADSGLDIDFKDANDETYIDIWNYIDEDFTFEPATSIDGRNIYFPTSGTFNSTNTSNMTFREGTVNDINSKYINIDFALTNTNAAGSEPMQVYLSSKSAFTIRNTKNSAAIDNGSALRLAFYNNDGENGNIGSSMLGKMKTTTDTAGNTATDTTNYTTVYFEIPRSNFTPHAYVWDTTKSDSYYKAWPGAEMTKVAGNLYSYTFPKTTGGFTFNKIIFTNGYDSVGTDKTNNLDIYPGQKYKINDTHSALTMRTTYFLIPTNWYVSSDPNSTDGVPKAYVATNSSGANVLESGGELMKKVTTGLYSYTYPSDYGYVKFEGKETSSSSYGSRYSNYCAVSADNKVCYFTSGANFSTVAYDDANIYFYNALDWDLPYAYVNAFPGAPPIYTYAIPMVALSGNVFYCTMPSVFLKDKMTSNQANCQVFFADRSGTSDGSTITYSGEGTVSRTVLADCRSDYIYRPLSTKTDGNYDLDPEEYSAATVGSGEQRYAVISPGVSAGFQRSANPVNEINTATGAVTSIIPTFASSFDDYIYGSNNPVFTIAPQQTVNMSMIIWLEGTDKHCTAKNYAAKYINLYLEFITVNSFGGADSSEAHDAEATYTYYFHDSTEQIWTSDSITNNTTHVTVNPVMQMYDKTVRRGYLMTQASTASYGGSSHVDVWKCKAPVAVATGSDGKRHDIEFRRVNPYNEDEVWNRWEAGVCQDYLTYARNSGNTEIHFTAFADGSPDYETYQDDIYGLPEKSCGGLWGQFQTEQLTVYDGRKRIDIGGGDYRCPLAQSGKLLSFRYTYTYGSGVSQTIEYRAGGPWRDMTASANNGYEYITREGFYSFVVPSTLYTKASNCQFVQYSGFDGTYAINSNLNTGLSLDHIWYAGTADGNFFEINEEGTKSPDNAAHSAKNTSDYHSYWGGDVIYVQVKNEDSLGNNVFNDRFAQMHFYAASSGTSSNDFYSYLYKNDYYKGSSSDYGAFVAVVPSNRAMYRYRVEGTESTTNKTLRYSTEEKTFSSHSTDANINGKYRNTTYDSTTKENRNILTIDKYYVYVYFSTSDWGSNYESPKLYYWNPSDTDEKYTVDSFYKGAGSPGKHYGASIPKGYSGLFFWGDDVSSAADYYITKDFSNATNGTLFYPNGTEYSNGKNRVKLGYNSHYSGTNHPGVNGLFSRRWNALAYKQNGVDIDVPAYEPKTSAS